MLLLATGCWSTMIALRCNALMESCFGTIKTVLEIQTDDSLRQAGREIREYINYYKSCSAR